MTRLPSIQETRLENFWLAWCEFATSQAEADQAAHGRLRRFANHGGLNAAGLNHMMNGRKNIGDDLARRIERGLGKPANWMDQQHLAPTTALLEAAMQVDEFAVRQLLLRIACGELARRRTVAAHAAAIHARGRLLHGR